MMEDLQNSSFAGNDDLLSDIPPAVVAGNEEHAAPPEEEPQPTAPPQEEPQPEKPRKTPPDTSVMKVSSFMGALVLLSIPIVNFSAPSNGPSAAVITATAAISASLLCCSNSSLSGWSLVAASSPSISLVTMSSSICWISFSPSKEPLWKKKS